MSHMGALPKRPRRRDDAQTLAIQPISYELREPKSSSAIIFLSLLLGLLVFAVVPFGTSFISAFPAHRFTQRQIQNRASGFRTRTVFKCV
jgi:hypothetical protein